MVLQITQRCRLFLRVQSVAIWCFVATATAQSPGCGRGFNAVSLPDDGQPFPAYAHVILPFMNFSCDGTITEFEFAESLAMNGVGTIRFEVWRPMASSSGVVTLFTSITSVAYTGGMQQNRNGHEITSLSASMPVSSGDVLGVLVPDGDILNILTTEISDFTVYQLKGGSSSDSTANIPSSYDSSSSYSPLVSVSFG
jgi:hypothetical protein